MSRSTFSVLFYANKSKLKNGIVPIMGRVTINGTLSQFSCKQSIPLDLWDVKDNHARELNRINEQHQQEVSNLKRILDNAYKWFPSFKRFLNMERECLQYGFNEEQTDDHFKTAPVIIGSIFLNDYFVHKAHFVRKRGETRVCYSHTGLIHSPLSLPMQLFSFFIFLPSKKKLILHARLSKLSCTIEFVLVQ